MVREDGMWRLETILIQQLPSLTREKRNIWSKTEGVTDSLNDSIGMKVSADNGCFPGSFTTLLPLYSLLTSLPWVKWCCGPYLPCFITVVYPDVLCEVRSRQSFMAQRFPSASWSFPLTWPARGLSTWPWLNCVQYRPSKMPSLRWDINSRACLS